MTEPEWLLSNDPAAMLAYLTSGHQQLVRYANMPQVVSDRKLRLFVCAVETAWWNQKATGGDRASIRLLEAIADGRAGMNVYHRITLTYSLPRNATACARKCVRIHNSNGDPPLWADLLRDIIGNPFSPTVLPVAHRAVECTKPSANSMTLVSPTGTVPYCPWFTTTAVDLAKVTYDRPLDRGPCYACASEGKQWLETTNDPVSKICQSCHGRGVVTTRHLDPDRLAILADALEDAGCNDQRLLGHLRGNRCQCVRDWDGDSTNLLGPDLGLYGGRLKTIRRCRRCGGTGKPLRPTTYVRGDWAVDLTLGRN